MKWKAKAQFFNCRGFYATIHDIENALEEGESFLVQVDRSNLQAFAMLAGAGAQPAEVQC